MRHLDRAPISGRNQQINRKRTKWTGKQKIGMGLILLLLFGSVIAGIGSLVAGFVYQRDLPIANDGAQHLQNAENDLAHFQKNLFDTGAITLAEQEFVVAQQRFMQVDSDLRYVPGAASYLPGYGNQIQASLQLVPLMLDLSSSGINGCKLLNTLIEQFHGHFTGLTQARLVSLGKDIQNLQTQLAGVLNDANNIGSAALQLDPRVSRLARVIHDNVPLMQRWLDRLQKALPTAIVLLGIGTPSNYLVEILDSTQLSPGGGFIENYNIGTMTNAAFTNAPTVNTKTTGATNPLPAKYQWFHQVNTNWSLGYSNLDTDFPTNAQNAEANYLKDGGKVSLQGVIAITPGLIQRAFAITGPIEMPEYNETVTANNYESLLASHQKAATIAALKAALEHQPAPPADNFAALLIDRLFSRLRQAIPSHLSQTVQIFTNSIHTKDIQLYLNDPVAENLLHDSQLDNAFQTPSHDGLFVVDANVGGNRANAFVTNTLTDTVTVDDNGDAIHHATLQYTWTAQDRLPGQDFYHDYVQVFVPAGSELLSQQGWQARGSSTIAGTTFWAGYLTLGYGRSTTVTLSWRVPHASVQTVQGWHYENLLQKQAGNSWQVNEQVTLPSCATIKKLTGELKAQGNHVAVLNMPLIEDNTPAINYTC